jgi:hypothetical protein
VVKDSVQNRRRDYRITENLTPISVRLVRSEYYRRLLVSPGNQLKETMGPFTVEGKITHLINNKERKLIECLNLLFKFILMVSFFQPFNQVRCISKVYSESLFHRGFRTLSKFFLVILILPDIENVKPLNLPTNTGCMAW